MGDRDRLGGNRLARTIPAASSDRATAVVERPWLVLGDRFGDAIPWSWAAPYHCHLALSADPQ